jgi:hypothetical protein
MQVLMRLICGIGSPTELKGLNGQTSITSSRSFRPGIPGKSTGMRFVSNCYEKAEKLTDRSDRAKGECPANKFRCSRGGMWHCLTTPRTALSA